MARLTRRAAPPAAAPRAAAASAAPPRVATAPRAAAPRRLTRAAFLRRVTLAAAATPLALPAGAWADEDDRAALNFALLLEDLQVTLYREALELDLGFDLAGLLRTFADHENEHVERLRALGGGSAEPLRFAYGLETRDELLQLAPTVEDTVVGAYIGAIPAATSPEVRALLAAIVHTEAQHASTWRMLGAEAAAPAAFDEVLSRTVLLDRVRPFIAT